MTTAVRNIVSVNPPAELWKYLRLFLNPERTAKRIREVHKIEEGKQRNNIAKQAIQIGQCIRQAEQYFKAAEGSGLATRPLLLYYGCVALSRALILLKRDGNYSLDGLRKAKKHRHHGLVLDEGKAEKAIQAKTVSDFFSDICCSCHIKEDGTPWGHFALFYESLAPSVFIQHVEIYESGHVSFLERDMGQVCADALSLNQFKNKRLRVIDLLKVLPDLYRDLKELGVDPGLAPGNLKRQCTQYIKLTPPISKENITGAIQEEKEIIRGVEEHDFFINELSGNSKNLLLSFFKEKNKNIVLAGDFPSNLHLKLTAEANQLANISLGYYPDIVENIAGAKFYILDPESYIHESAALLAIMFCLGMLSRYYPDLWMGTINKNIDVVEITNSLLAAVTRKFPNLILDQMSGVKHHIHL